ncbi:MAG: hypothetical protein SNJ85_05340 [Cyanobacteriota bacterium]
MILSLGLASLEGAQAQTSLTGINRASQMQLNIGGRGGSTAPAANAGSEAEMDSSVPSPQMWAEWHIRANVCTGNLSTEELAALFPMVNQALVDTVCQGGS